MEQTTGVRIKFLLRIKENFPMFFDRPCIDVCHSHISISSTVTVAFLVQSFHCERCHCTVIATVLGNYHREIGFWKPVVLAWRNGCQADRTAGHWCGKKRQSCLGYHGRNLQKEGICNKMIRRNFLIEAAKSGFSLGSVFSVDLQLSVWIIKYAIFT